MLIRGNLSLLVGFFLLLASTLSIAAAELQVVPKILNGQRSYDDTPWMVSIVFDKGQCAGTLIDDEWVLTAAHCLEDVWVGRIQLLVGAQYVNLERRTYDKGHLAKADSFYIHPDYERYKRNALINDIALIKLTSPIIDTDTILVIDREVNQLPEGTELRVYGWGVSRAQSPYTETWLHTATLALTSKEACDNTFGKPLNIPTESFFCAESHSFIQQGVCVGDSGGPVVYEGDGYPQQVGIISWGPECGQPVSSAVYMDVHRLNPFIQQVKAGEIEPLKKFSIEAIELPKKKKSGGSVSLGFVLLLGCCLLIGCRNACCGIGSDSVLKQGSTSTLDKMLLMLLKCYSCAINSDPVYTR